MNRITMVGVGSILIIVLISALMIPMTSEFSKNIYSYEENENVRYSLSDRSETVKITTSGGITKINNEPLNEMLYSGSSMIMFGDTFIITYIPASEGVSESITFFDGASGTYNQSLTTATFQKGEFTVSGTNTNDGDFTYSGTYGYMFHASKHGNYCAAAYPIISTEAKIYFIRASGGGFGVYTGTYDNMEKVFYSSNDISDLSINVEVEGTDPDTVKIMSVTGTGVTGNYKVIVPLDYPHVSNVDQMTRTIVSLSPLFVGILLFAAIGIYITRLSKS